jgi:O-methyltransferase
MGPFRGSSLGDESQTRRLLKRLRIEEPRCKIVRGWFEDSVPASEIGPDALLHVDCNFDDPVKLVLETSYEPVTRGSYVVLNDYGRFIGCKKATEELQKRLEPPAHLITIDHDAFYFQKPWSCQLN